MRIIERRLQLAKRDRFFQNVERTGVPKLIGSPAGDEDNTSVRMMGQNIATGGGAIELGHAVVHDDDIRLVTGICLDGLQAGADDLDYFMLALVYELGQ